VESEASTLVRSTRNARARLRLAGIIHTHYLFSCPIRFPLVLVSRLANYRSRL
jgi:hypothetical protein